MQLFIAITVTTAYPGCPVFFFVMLFESIHSTVQSVGRSIAFFSVTDPDPFGSVLLRPSGSDPDLQHYMALRHLHFATHFSKLSTILP